MHPPKDPEPMNHIIIGACMLLGVVLFRQLMRRFRYRRLLQAWKEAQARLEDNDLEGAQALLQRCTRLEPLWLPARGLHAATLMNLGRFDEAEKEFQLVAQLEPRNHAGHLDLGMFYACCLPDRKDAAIEALAKAVECEPKVREFLATDRRLDRLRQEPGFQELLEEG